MSRQRNVVIALFYLTVASDCFCAAPRGSEIKPPAVLEVSAAEVRLREGKGSLADAQQFIIGDLAVSTGGTDVPKSALVSERIKIEDEKIGELFLSWPGWPGTGGNLYFVFKEGPQGLRLLGSIWFGSIQRVAPDSTGRTRVLTFSSAGAGTKHLQLHVLKPDGFHVVASHFLNLADCATADGSVWLYDEFFTKDAPSPEALRAVFGSAY